MRTLHCIPVTWPAHPVSFGQAFLAAREAIGRTRAEVAKQAHVTDRDLRDAEAGHCPSPDVRQRLIDALWPSKPVAFGQAVQQALRSLGRTQGDLAARAELRPTQISRVIEGTATTDQTRAAILRAFADPTTVLDVRLRLRFQDDWIASQDGAVTVDGHRVPFAAGLAREPEQAEAPQDVSIRVIPRDGLDRIKRAAIVRNDASRAAGEGD